MATEICFVTGGCGFVGRRLINRLRDRHRVVVVVDDLSTGQHPRTWMTGYEHRTVGSMEIFRQSDFTLQFLKADAVEFFWRELRGERFIDFSHISEVYHLASVVGGRAVTDSDPLLVATDLAINSLFFRWLAKNKSRIGRVLFASSSAAYPINLQENIGQDASVPLTESMIGFNGNMGEPDMTYGWSKLTGEYLSLIAAEKYGLKVACARPFSGYGEDQDLSYPVPAIAYRAAGRERPMTVWGTGRQGRDFVHVDDCIEAFFRIIENISDGRGVNIGTGKLTSMIEIAGTLIRLEGYETEIKSLVDAPMGVQSRYCDPSLITSLGWRPTIPLEEGLSRVLEMAHRRRLAATGS